MEDHSTSSGPTLADVVRRFGSEYASRYGRVMMPSQKKAMADIAACRTRERGGRLLHCDDCDRRFWIYHGCRNRSCPTCHGRRSQEWLEQREAELLPCDYFHVVVTLPEQLRHACLAEQKIMYGLLMRISADVLKEMSGDKKYLCALPGILAVLHTWTARMTYHPHVHMLVTSGGITEDARSWREPRGRFLVPVRAFSQVVRSRFRDVLKTERPHLFAKIPADAWTAEWCSYCKHYGTGREVVLRYLSRYVHRIAIDNSRILAVDATHVTFRYKDRRADRWRTMRLAGVEFLRRFLMHVLPKGFHKVRYYGLWHHARRDLAAQAWLLLILDHSPDDVKRRYGPLKIAELTMDENPFMGQELDSDPDRPACPNCGGRRTRVIQELPRPRSP